MAALGCEGHIFNLKKHCADASDIHGDYIKDYEYLYHVNMKTAHLENIYVYFIAPSYNQAAINYYNTLQPRIIQRFGCAPCEVNYILLSYSDLAGILYQKTNPHAFRGFVVNYGRNV